MNYIKRPFGLLFLTLMTLIAFEVATKKPLCLSSSIVNKIDRLSTDTKAGHSSKQLDSIYACSSYQVPVFSSYFYENLRQIDARLVKLEILFSGLALNSKVNIFIDERAQNLNSFRENTLSVSPDILNTKAFEMSLLKIALNKRINFQNQQFSVVLAHILAGHPSDEDPFTDLWQKTYSDLGIYEKFRFTSALRRQIATSKEFSEISIADSLMSLLNSENYSVQNFKNHLQNKMQASGLVSFDPSFDLIIEAAPNVKLKKANIGDIAKKFSNQRVLLQTQDGALVLPYLVPLKLDQVSQVTSKSRILIVASSEDTVDFKAYAENTDSLIVMNSLGNESEIQFESLFKNGIDRFLGANKQFNFIQFHLPSLIYRQDELKSVSNYFNFLKEAKSASIKERGLGWASVGWSKDLQAYKPVAVYDVIQYYRLN